MKVDEDYVFFVTPTELTRIDQQDSPEVEVLNSHATGSSNSSSRRVAVHADFVFESGGTNVGNGFVNRLPKSGGTPLNIFFSFGNDPSAYYPRFLDVGPVRALWAHRYTDVGSGTTVLPIRGAALDGGDPETYVTFTQNTGIYLASTASHAYWYDQFDDELHRALLTGTSGPTAILAGLTNVDGVVVGEDRLYFAGEIAGTYAIYSVAADGGDLQSVISETSPLFGDDQGESQPLVFDAGEILWLSTGAGGSTLNAVGADGSAPRELYTGTANLDFPAADTDAYFWYTDDQIWMMVK